MNNFNRYDIRLEHCFSDGLLATLAIRENTITVIPDEWGPEEEECWDGCDAPVEIEETEETDPVPPSNDEDEDEDTDPYFSQGSSTTRSVPENSAIGSSVGSPVRAYAGNGGSLTYSIGGTNGSSFTVSSSTGQIRVNTSLDYELKNQYHVTLTVNETGSGSDTISVTINVTNVVDDDEDNDPYFSQGSSTTRSVRENSAIGSSVGSPVRAYAGNGGSLTYSIGGTNSSSFTVSSSTGQIRVNTSLDYESKNRSYVTLTVNETGSGSDSISVTINVTNVVEYVPPTPPVPPVFAYDYTNRSVPENRPSGTAVGAPVTATDPNGDRLTYSINGSNFAINSSTGQITTTRRHNYESTRTHRLTVTATDPGGLTDTTQVTIRITNVNETPVAADLIAFAVTGFPVNINVLANDSDPDGNSLSVSSVADPPHGAAVINADHTVTYTSDAAFTGQDSFTYRASDGRLSDSATVTVTVSDDCSSGIAVVDPADNPGLVLDCAILLNLGRSIKGTGSLNWSEDVLITDWDGITVDGSPRRVTVIDVRSKKLIGNIPIDPITLLGITYLDALRKIVLNNNDLNGSIPAQIGSLPNLVGLYAASSGLSGQIPVELGNLPKLENLYIYGNDLDGQIPATLGNIATLQGLDLSDNNLTGSIPTALGQLTNLGTLTLTRNQLSGSIPAALGNLNNLNWLHLQHNGLTGNLPHELGQLSNLERLGFNHNKITGGIPSELGDLRNLTHLYLARNDYADTACIPGALSYVKNHDFVRSGLPFCSDPHITEGESATRTVAENSPADTHIGNPFQLGNGADAGTVTWSISGADHTAFSIDAGSGQLRTKDPLDYETRNQYSLIVTASNDKSEFDTVVVTVHVTDVNELPVAKDDTATTDEDVPVTIAVLSNDTDQDQDPLSVTQASDPSLGSVTINADGTVTYTPDADLSGADSFTYTVSDGTETATGSVNVTVNSLRDDPYFAEGPSPGSGTGAAVRREIAENSPIGSDVGAPVGALDPDGDTVTYSLGGPDSASFSIAATTGQIQSKETLDYEAQQNIYNVTVEVTDGIDANGNADPAVDTTLSVTIHVTDVNESPQAVNDTARIAEDANVVVDVLVNDTDRDAGAVLTVTAVSTPTHGSAVITGKSVTYAPSTDFSGQDQFTYTVSDGELFATATVTVTVTPVDDPPVAEDDTATTEEDTLVNIAVLENDSDVDTDSANLSVTINTTPANGAAAVRSDHSIDYTPQADYVGVDSFTYTLSDGTSEDHASVRITVNAVNDPPGFNEESTGSGDGGLENSDLVTRQVGGNSAAGANIGEPVPATDPDGDQLSYALDGTDRDAFSIDSNNGQLKTKASLDFETKSTYSVTVTVSDGKDQDGNPDGSVDASIDVKINVTDVNEAPIAADDRAVVAEDSSVNIDVLRNDTDPDANTNLAVTANTEPAHGTAVFNQDHSITYTPDADYNGADSFNYTVSDGAFTDTASVTLTVTPVEDSPRFQDQDGNDITGGETSRNVDENTPAGRNIGEPIAAVDPDGQSLAFALGNSDDDAAFAIDDATGQIKTKASLDFEDKAAYRITVTATDTASNSSSVTVDISVNDRNETPSFDESSPVTRSVDENVALGTNVGAPVTATDQDAGSLPSYSLLGSHDAAAFSIDPDSGQISVDAALDRETQDRYTFQVSASDGSLSAEIEVVVTILNVDEPPVAQDDSITTNEDTAVNIPVLENDTDVDTDRDNLVITIQDPPAHGTAAVQADQTVQYTPEAEYSGSDRFTYSVSDGTGFDEASVSVTIDDANDRPVFDEAPPQNGEGTPEGSAVTRAVAENTPAGQNIGEAISANDAEDDRLTYGFTGADSTQFDIDANTGQLKTKEPLNYEDKFSYSFEVTVSDGKDEDGNADPSVDSSISVTVTVTDANDAPVANDDSTNVDEDSSVVISVLANDADEDAGDTLHIVSATDPSHGAITINDGGTLTYVPEANFNGADSFEYTLSDGELSDTGLVQITVNPVQDSPDFEEDDPDGNGDGNSENLDDPVTREIAENTPPGENIGDPVTDTDPDDDTLTYSLEGPDSASFSIDAGNGQLRTKDPLNYELKNSYSVTVVATDPDDNAARVDVTINVTDVNDAPTFPESGTTARTVAENSPVGTNVGIPVTATDEDTGSSLTYSLGGLDVADFEIDPDNGQLITGTYLDHEAKSSYQLIVSVDDGEHTAETRVTVAVDDLAEPPAAPSPPIVTTEGKSSLRATWTTPDNTGPAISGYQVRYQAVGSGTWTALGSNLTATEVLIPGLAMNQHYQVQVQAVNEEGSSPWSTSGLGSTAAGPPDPPGNFRATPSNPRIYLTWDTPTTHGEPITGYQYQRSEDRARTWSGGWMIIPRSVPGQTNSNHYVVDSLDVGTEYSFRVRAMSKAGPSDESQIATATAADYPGAPRGLQADATQREVALTWTPAGPNGAPITGYELQQDGSAWTEIRGGGSATSTTVTGLNAGATFTFQLRALNIIGAGTAASVTVTTEVVARPPASGGGGGGGGRTPLRVAKTPTPTPAVPATPATKPTVLPTAVPIATPVPVTPTPMTPAPTPITSVAPPPESTPAPAAGGARRKHRGPAGRFPAQHRPEWHRRDLSARPRPHAGGTGHPSQLPVRRRDP